MRAFLFPHLTYYLKGVYLCITEGGDKKDICFSLILKEEINEKISNFSVGYL